MVVINKFIGPGRLPSSSSQDRAQTGKLFPQTIFRIALLACVACICSSNQILAQAGQLDSTFAMNGVFSAFSGFPGGSTRIALQSDGKILVAAASGNPQLHTSGMALARLNADGGLDSSFGTGGVVSFGLAHGVPTGVIVQSDGKIVVGGTGTPNVDGSNEFALARFNTSGSVDTTFGSGGQVITSVFSEPTAGGAALVLQPDQKFLMVGANAIARYNTTGQLDNTFGSGGLAELPGFGADAIGLQSDGKILIASTTFAGNGILSRYNPNGSIDKTFGLFGTTGGVATAAAVVVQNDGKIVLAGSAPRQLLNPPAANLTGFALIRYNRNGTLDTSFGTRGGVITGFPTTTNASSFALAAQPNGDLIAAGQAGTDFALARYVSSGKLDTTFGAGGTVATSLDPISAKITSLVLQSDGKILAGGMLAGDTESAVARYLGQ